MLLKSEKWVKSGVCDLSIALVDSRTMSRLHARYLGLPGPTDVLTFPLERGARNRVTSGEIIICVPFARRQARLRGHSLRSEILLYVLHGLLHLAGYDDRTRDAFDRMHRTEDMILRKIGVGSVFARGESKRAAARCRAGRTRRPEGNRR
ncbi:MAG: rRNA maturation RNase YbeY [Phycisphaerales bacterium]|nr:rRNA maturation RNase YbeY [Phycisphaerales bacterium]